MENKNRYLNYICFLKSFWKNVKKKKIKVNKLFLYITSKII